MVLAPNALFAAVYVSVTTPSNQVTRLRSPIDVAVSERYLFVLQQDYDATESKENAHYIDVFDREQPHARVACFGKYGKEEGLFFHNPSGMALNRAGDRLAIVEAGNDRVQVFSVDGSELTFVNGFGGASPVEGPAPDGTFKNPGGVAFMAVGTILVADTGNHRVQLFSSDGTHFSTIPLLLNPAAQLTGICADEEDLGFWVTIKDGQDSRIEHYALDGSGPSSQFFSRDITDQVALENRYGVFDFDHPPDVDYMPPTTGGYRDVCVVDGGYIAVSDEANSEIFIFDAFSPGALLAGQVTTRLMRAPDRKDDYAFVQNPGGIFFDSTSRSLFVSDSGFQKTARIFWYDLVDYVPPVPPSPIVPPATVYPGGATGDLVVTPALTSTNSLESSQYNTGALGASPYDVAVVGEFLYALERHSGSAETHKGDRIAVYKRGDLKAPLAEYETFPDLPEETRRLRSPESIAANRAGTLLAVADTYNDRVLLFDMDGEKLSFKQAVTNVVLTACTSTEDKALSPTFIKPTSVSFGDGDELLVADKGNSRVLRFSAADSYGTAESYAIGAGRSTLEAVCQDTLNGAKGFWAADNKATPAPTVSFYPYGSASPSYVFPSIFSRAVKIQVWNDGVTNRLAILDNLYSALLVFQQIPGANEMRLCALAGSTFSTNSYPSPKESTTRLWAYGNLWNQTTENGETTYSPNKVMEDATVPKLQGPTGFDVYAQNGTNVIFVADHVNSRIVWYGGSIDGVEGSGTPPVPPDPPDPPVVKEVAWPIASVSIEPRKGDDTVREVVIGWSYPAGIMEKKGQFRIDAARDLMGPWASVGSVVIGGQIPQGDMLPLPEFRIDSASPKLDPDRNFFTLWWVGEPLSNP